MIEKIDVVEKYELPPNTCPLIDDTITALEKVRIANEKLREVSRQYFRDNSRIAETSSKLLEYNKELKAENETLKKDNAYYLSLQSADSKESANELILTHRQSRRIQELEEVLQDCLLAVNASLSLPGFIKNLRRGSSKQFIKDYTEAQVIRQKELKKQLLAKFTSEEKELFSLSTIRPIFDTDDEEEDGDDN